MTTILDCIGETPLVTLGRMVPPGRATIQAKLEFLGPTGSIKDRIARYIILKAEREGLLKPGGTIIESTSGNTGAAVAMIAAARGYRAILVMPAKASIEKQIAARAMGAEVIVAPPDSKPGDPLHYVQRSLDLAREIPNSFRINQYDNPDNPEAHYLSTGPEIWRQTQGRIDYFVCSASTGGTLSGTARYLREQNPALKVVMADPDGSIYAGYFRTGRAEPPNPPRKYQVEGVGKDHLVDCMDFSVVDEVMTFCDQDAFGAARRLAREEGILAGGSSGANVWASLQLAERLSPEKVIVTVLPDSGLKYFSKFYDDHWLATHVAKPSLALSK
ncbi:MAG TPA: cysteine synthase family protein [Stellaceae bacterium]|nr:cysteine synthase family protein [Stellaceae bacterium]